MYCFYDKFIGETSRQYDVSGFVGSTFYVVIYIFTHILLASLFLLILVRPPKFHSDQTQQSTVQSMSSAIYPSTQLIRTRSIVGPVRG
jgi:hypothetical protein